MFKICTIDSRDLVSIYRCLSNNVCFVRFGSLSMITFVEVSYLQELEGSYFYKLVNGDLINSNDVSLWYCNGDHDYCSLVTEDASAIYNLLTTSHRVSFRLYKNQSGSVSRVRDLASVIPFLRLAKQSNLYAGTLLVRVAKVVTANTESQLRLKLDNLLK